MTYAMSDFRRNFRQKTGIFPIVATPFALDNSPQNPLPYRPKQ
ncbi:MAG: hypothetical protein PHT48_12490 [Dechloromonas sp.]|nr:hypothetical protein [Dechloromonas sp.]